MLRADREDFGKEEMGRDSCSSSSGRVLSADDG